MALWVNSISVCNFTQALFATASNPVLIRLSSDSGYLKCVQIFYANISQSLLQVSITCTVVCRLEIYWSQLYIKLHAWKRHNSASHNALCLFIQGKHFQNGIYADIKTYFWSIFVFKSSFSFLGKSERGFRKDCFCNSWYNESVTGLTAASLSLSSRWVSNGAHFSWWSVTKMDITATEMYWALCRLLVIYTIVYWINSNMILHILSKNPIFLYVLIGSLNNPKFYFSGIHN